MTTGKPHFLYAPEQDRQAANQLRTEVNETETVGTKQEQPDAAEPQKEKKNFFQRIREALREWSAGEEE